MQGNVIGALFALAVGLGLGLGPGLALTAAAQEPAWTMQSEEERAAPLATGPWQGNWLVIRADERLRTRGGSVLARLHIIQDAGDDAAMVDWAAGPAICPDPLDYPPCEWEASRGETSSALASDTGLYVFLPVSADLSAPMLLHLARPEDGAAGVAYDGHLRYRVMLEREPD